MKDEGRHTVSFADLCLDEWIKKTWYIHPVEDYAAFKKVMKRQHVGRHSRGRSRAEGKIWALQPGIDTWVQILVPSFTCYVKASLPPQSSRRKPCRPLS